MLKVFVGVGIAVAMTGCADDTGAETELSTTEQMLGSNVTLPSGVLVPNSIGASTTYSSAEKGRINLGNEFFQDLGTNDRRCVSCHLPTAGWSITPGQMQAIFNSTNGGAYDDGFGLGAVFRTNDGSNSPDAPVGTLAERRAAYSMLLTRGTIRVGIGVPATTEFELVDIDDPYGFAHDGELSLFRRPLPSTNLTMIPQVMWDGRVSFGMPTGSTVNDALAAQSNGATMGHAQRPTEIPNDPTRLSIVGFETGLFTAQVVAKDSGSLTAEGGRGGAKALMTQAFVANRFNLYDAWQNSTNAARRSVWRGQELFNNRQRSTTVPGTLIANTTLLAGTCRACHSAENSGTNKAGVFFTVGVSDGENRQADQPLYSFRDTRVQIPTSATNATLIPNPNFGQVITTTDPGRALITGKWADMNKFKVPSLRALGSRAPYFHDGSANNLTELVEFYEGSLDFVFTDAERKDLVAFLSAL